MTEQANKVAKHQYDPETGIVTVTKESGEKIQATNPNKKGYFRTTYHGKKRILHIVAWHLHYGEWPDGQIDHINGDRQDNRISNLRLATPAQNAQNRAARPDSKSGLKGVSFSRQKNSFIATIHINGNRVKRSRKDPFLASLMYDHMAQYAWGEFARINHPEFQIRKRDELLGTNFLSDPTLDRAIKKPKKIRGKGNDATVDKK